jgi:hypothetical protein
MKEAFPVLDPVDRVQHRECFFLSTNFFPYKFSKGADMLLRRHIDAAGSIGPGCHAELGQLTYLPVLFVNDIKSQSQVIRVRVGPSGHRV